jgi:hypothetical protein
MRRAYLKRVMRCAKLPTVRYGPRSSASASRSWPQLYWGVGFGLVEGGECAGYSVDRKEEKGHIYIGIGM